MLKQVLEEFLSLEGVTTAAVVGLDGFVIEIAETRRSDADALGALCSSAMRFFEAGGKSMRMGSVRQIVLESRNGNLILTPITGEEFLAILTNTDSKTVLGTLTYSLAKSSYRLAAAM